MKYADSSPDLLGSHGAASVGRMREVAAAFDATGLLQRRIPGGCKISRVL